MSIFDRSTIVGGDLYLLVGMNVVPMRPAGKQMPQSKCRMLVIVKRTWINSPKPSGCVVWSVCHPPLIPYLSSFSFPAERVISALPLRHAVPYVGVPPCTASTFQNTVIVMTTSLGYRPLRRNHTAVVLEGHGCQPSQIQYVITGTPLSANTRT